MADWTKAQQDAIEARGGPLLVGAAAGSGKTSVLVERAVRLICDEHNPVDADKLLIVTYTNAAAAEMKRRIGASLSALIRERPENLRLLGQQALLSRAHIGTIHAFCLGLIRENFQHLHITGDFTVADEGELELMRRECARAVLEEGYEREDKAAFLELVELLSGGRDDSRVIQVLLRLYDFARSHPFYLSWLDKIQALYGSSPVIEETKWGQSLLSYAAETLDFCIGAMEAALLLIRTDPAVESAYGPGFAADLAGLKECRAALGSGSWDEAVGAVAAMNKGFARLGRLSGSEALKRRVTGQRDRCKKLIKKLAEGYLNATSADFAADLEDLAPKLEALFDLARAFDTRFTAEKARKKRLDYADLEHLALSLLARENGQGGVERTQLALALAQGFEHVLVDEYQDVNEVQELLFTCVSRMQRNLFMVGDAKQSIYSFRLATPAIFLQKQGSYSPYSGDGGEFPAKIALDVNFRSREQVTGAVNFLFGLLMSRAMGGIGYGEEERLVCGASFPEGGADCRPELLLLDAGDYDGEGEASQLEAGLVARRIAAMLEEGFLVAEGEELRPCRPGDFCILMRSPKKRLQAYVKALEGEGLPVLAQNADGFFALREVSMVLALLEALDNPLLDLPLVSALLSPLFGFTDDDVARLRMVEKGAPFYLNLQAAAREAAGGALAQKCGHFLKTFTRLRERAAVLPADRLLLELYRRTDALAVVRVMPMGENRRANLLLLVEYAAAYHNRGYKQLGGFVGFLTRLRERGGDLAPAGAAGEGAGAVRIMSVHRSKGLEFPIVILADTAKGFNRSDQNQSFQLHSEYGFACARRSPDTMSQYATLPMQAIRLESGRDLLGEELRILYVALTRAKEKLIVTGCAADLARRLERAWGEAVDGRLNPRGLEEAKAPLDWLLAALLHHPDGGELRLLCGESEQQPLTDANPWRIAILPAAEQPLCREAAGELPRTAAPDPILLARLEERAAWRYPYSAQTRIPTKLAVSEAAKGETGESRFLSRPRFMEQGGLTPTERGNALHKFMQFADYRAAKTDLEAEISRMADRRYLSPEEARGLSREQLRAFFEGTLARRIFAADQVWRELRFLGEYGREVLGERLEGMDDDARVTLQGVADCVFLEKGRAVVVDYKTDRVKTPEELLERYARQLELYRLMLSEALPAPVEECLLYSFSLERAIRVE